MSNLKKLLAEREQRWRSNLDELVRLVIPSYAAFVGHPISRIPFEDFERAKRRYRIACEDRVWAERGFNGPHRPRIGESIAKPQV